MWVIKQVDRIIVAFPFFFCSPLYRVPGRLSLFDMRFPAGTIREQLGTIREQISCNILANHRLKGRTGWLFLPDSGTKISLPGSLRAAFPSSYRMQTCATWQ
jgi:hypothetical protein